LRVAVISYIEAGSNTVDAGVDKCEISEHA
jgi:hypothetical protein